MSAQTIAEKILSAHCGREAHPGEIVFCSVDVMMAHDANGPLAVRAFQSLEGKQVCAPEQIHFIMDHAAPAPYERVANLHMLLRQFAADQGIDFIEGGEGVCHQLMMERNYVKAGDIVLGTDSHTCTYGAVGAFATGVGATDMGVSLYSGKNWFKVPETIRIDLKGKLPANCSAKDVILYIIGLIGAAGGNYFAFEFYGDYLDHCSLADRMTIANMVVEMGGKAGFICSRDLAIQADPGASYIRCVEVDLQQLKPGLARPHQVDAYAPVEELAGMSFQMAFLGSCTNGRIEDLREVERVLRGRKIAKNVRLLIIPASKAVLMQAMEEGIMQELLRAGASLFTPGCGACVGTHGGVPGDGEIVLSTANRNFKGRMGNNKAFIYLVSPKTLAASCLTGVLTVPVE
ncbi:3-isopropylmalate dehydratase large subunit [Pseudoflavonifractor sp. 60]|uniref:3-isopropylmalate dehydratase large subunit n=1 Tax=Pseudoflavonifractor sp. 60 TaxID=2304576 RepID=UPI0013682731|nr:3-isopropylmalate dehydratase large subunit [Pseudoflavonifractor sp. 60]NBI68970.1 3-isopropylmalate dehydratase large subunit [Pseudoflavonifractor sp. 60]